MKTITIPSFAKINLILRVTGKRKDGYHSLETVFQTLDLHDRLTFRFDSHHPFGVQLQIHNHGIPEDETNLIYRACSAFHQIHRIPFRVEVEVEKNIPIESGLGGGSSNAAATLIVLSRLLDWPVNRTKLMELARSLGADVPFFLFGGTAYANGRGDRIKPLEDWPHCEVLVVHPEVTCSTAMIYRKFDESGLLTRRRNFIKIHLDQRPESLRDFVSHIENDLEKVVFALYPELESIKKRLYAQGAVAAAMTGSGSAVFGLFKDTGELEKAAGYFPVSYKTHFLTRREYEVHLGMKSSFSF